MKNKVTLLLIALLAVALVACQEPPQQQIDASKQALTEAETAGAATWAGPEYEEAKAALAAANAEIEAQNGKFALFRNYEQATQLLADAGQKAAAAATAAADNKAQAKAAAEAAKAAADTALAAAQAQLATLEGCKRKPKGFDTDLEALKGRLDALAADAAGLDSKIAAEDYNGAQASAQAVQDGLAPLATDMQSVIDKLKC